VEETDWELKGVKVKWNDIGDNEIAGLLKEAAETIESEELQELMKIAADRLHRASERHRNLSNLVWRTKND